MAKKNQALEDYLLAHPDESNADIAKKFGVAQETVSRHRSRMVSAKPTEGLQDAIYALLKKHKKRWTVAEISSQLDAGVNRVNAAIEGLRQQGKNLRVVDGGLELSSDIPRSKPTIIDTSKFGVTHYKFGLTADNHLCSRYERLDVLNALFDIWHKQGVTEVLQCGNMIDGEAKFNKFDIHTYGMANQVRYFAENWPRRDGMVTRFATGDDHEGWYIQREGVNIGQMIEDEARRQGRDDLSFLGHMEHDIVLKAKRGHSVMRVIHAGGGSSYATSYSVQKIVESYQGGEKPHILLVGHYHKAEYGYPREVHCVQAGCTVDQTPFMRKNKIQGHLGGWTIEFDQDEAGIIHGFKCQWHPFYDKGFYDRAWKYQW